VARVEPERRWKSNDRTVTLALILGGSRSGKKRLAVDLAREHEGAVVFLATGEAGDGEMSERIAQHRLERPTTWRTVEEPVQLEAAIRGVDPEACLIVDCLSLWLSNRFEQATDSEVRQEALGAAAAACERSALTFAVSNEVGLGLVPMHSLGRRYRDLLGEVNSIWAEKAERAFFVAAGRVLRLEPPPSLREFLS